MCTKRVIQVLDHFERFYDRNAKRICIMGGYRNEGREIFVSLIESIGIKWKCTEIFYASFVPMAKDISSTKSFSEHPGKTTTSQCRPLAVAAGSVAQQPIMMESVSPSRTKTNGASYSKNVILLLHGRYI